MLENAIVWILMLCVGIILFAASLSSLILISGALNNNRKAEKLFNTLGEDAKKESITVISFSQFKTILFRLEDTMTVVLMFSTSLIAGSLAVLINAAV